MAGRDLVIIDSPPVMSASETADLAREVDGVVMVIREDAKLSDIADARERLSLTGTPILGYIYNRSSQRVDNYTYRSAPPAADRLISPPAVWRTAGRRGRRIARARRGSPPRRPVPRRSPRGGRHR